MGPTNKTFCVLPWMHAELDPDGRSYLCCRAREAQSLGQLNTHTLQQIRSGQPYQAIRQSMLQGQKVSACIACYEDEADGIQSMRQRSNAEFATECSQIKQADPLELKSLGIRFSNLCNLKCRTCSPAFSTAWKRDFQSLKFKDKHSQIVIENGLELKSLKQYMPQLLKLTPKLKKIYFAGGEPLITPEHFSFLQYLIEHNYTDVSLIYNTNLSHLDYRGNCFIDMWKQFKHVDLAISFDGIQEKSDLLRKGLKWQVAMANFDRLSAHPFKLTLFPTISILNCFHLTELMQFFLASERIRPEDILLNKLLAPEHYCIDILPSHIKKQLVVSYTKFMNQHLLKLFDFQSALPLIKQLKSLLNFDTSENTDTLRSLFIEQTQQIDRLRSENTFELFPELDL